MQRVTSRRHEVVEAFRSAARSPGTERRLTLLDGVHLVREADCAPGWTLAAVAVLDSLWETHSEQGALAHDLDARGIEVYVVTEAVMNAMSPVKTPSGIAAVIAGGHTNFREMFEANSNALIVVALNVQDPGNVGAVIRSAEAMAADAVLVDRCSANPFGWKALRGSMGSALRLPVTSSIPDRPGELIECARRYGFRLVASTPRNGKPPHALNWNGRVAICVGGEGPGLPEAIIEAAEERVTIPMAAEVESLNVAVATALILYEARRQRS